MARGAWFTDRIGIQVGRLAERIAFRSQEVVLLDGESSVLSTRGDDMNAGR